MSSGILSRVRTTAAAYLIASAYKKYLPDHDMFTLVEDLRESILHAATLCVNEVREDLRQPTREEPEMGDGQRNLPAERESLTAGCRCGTGCDPAAPDFLDRCHNLARLVLDRGSMPTTTASWTRDSGEFVLTAFIAFVAVCEPEGRRRNLLTVRKLLTTPGHYKAAIQAMQHVGQEGDLIRRLGLQLTWLNELDLSSVMLMLMLRTAWMESTAEAARLASPVFELRRLRLDRGPALLAPARDGLAARWGARRAGSSSGTDALDPGPVLLPIEG